MNSIKALSVFPQLAKFLPLDEYEHACIVAGMCKDDERICMVALLHDVVEDGYATFDELRERFNLDAGQMAALDAITRRKGGGMNNFFFRFILGLVVGWIFWSLAFWAFGEKFNADQWGVIALLALIMGVINAVIDC